MLHHLCVKDPCPIERNPNARFVIDSLIRDERDLGIKAAERGVLASLVSLVKFVTPLDTTDEWEMDEPESRVSLREVLIFPISSQFH